MDKLTIEPKGKVERDKSTEIIHAEGDVKIKIFVLVIIGSLLGIIALGGIAGLIINEAVFGKYWSGLQAILSGAIFGLVGFIAGQSASKNDKNH